MTMNLKFEGVFPANPTPYKDGKILEEALRGIFEDNISHGVNGFWVAGSTGEGPILNDSQRETVARITGESCNGRGISIMHVGAISTQSSIKGAKAAYDSGCDAICCVPPFFYTQDDDGVVEHYQAVASVSDLPFFIYNLDNCFPTPQTSPIGNFLSFSSIFSFKYITPVFSFLAI